MGVSPEWYLASPVVIAPPAENGLGIWVGGITTTPTSIMSDATPLPIAFRVYDRF